MTTDYNTPAKAAAEWWATAIQAPRFDNGDTGMGSLLAGALATMVAANQPAPSDHAQRGFVVSLAARVETMLRRGDYCSLGVDYGPDANLANSAEDAGLSTARFPWKTNMWVTPDRITVSAGYGAAEKLVWASQWWLTHRPTCGRQQYDEAKYLAQRGYKGEPWACSLPEYHDEPHQYDVPLTLCAACGLWHGSEANHAFKAASEGAES